MALKSKIDLVFDDQIAANGNDIKTSQIIPNGKQVTLKIFGGLDPAIGDGRDSLAILQWGNQTNGWKTVRAGTKLWNFELNKNFIGNGKDMFRLVRQNKSASAKVIGVWLEALIHDA